jgi:rSAM/selenodomain-associated transferase 1
VKIGVGIMARAPSSGGKTRLAPHLPARRLHALRTALLADTLHALHSVPDCVIYFTPDEAEHEVASLADAAMPRVPQGSGDLGARMLRAVKDLFEAGKCDAAILVGSDIPWLGPDHLRVAGDLLRGDIDVVLGPAADGGYYLIGMRQVHAPLFENIEWGTGSVLNDTLRSAQQIGVNARLVRVEYDVDTIEDLHRLERDLGKAPPSACPHLRRWFSES